MSVADSFCKSGFARFISSVPGRVARVVVGAAVIWYAYTHVDGTAGVVLMAIGAIPFVAGALDWCLISALLGGPLSGARIRSGAGSA